ncbi:unnamed protein product [Mycena citricolor]|uniref:Uncharacterized protein n=1 Tax=Mycena citricolor TaxID=2018698 RepID=A0AAD2Q1L7_9AGAR|nr:unnamed protein product [Mycena citricolor]
MSAVGDHIPQLDLPWPPLRHWQTQVVVSESVSVTHLSYSLCQLVPYHVRMRGCSLNSLLTLRHRLNTRETIRRARANTSSGDRERGQVLFLESRPGPGASNFLKTTTIPYFVALSSLPRTMRIC